MENEKKQTNELYDHLHYEWSNKTSSLYALCDAYGTVLRWGSPYTMHRVIYLEFQFEQVTRNQMLQIFDVDHFRWFRKQTDGVPVSILRTQFGFLYTRSL